MVKQQSLSLQASSRFMKFKSINRKKRIANKMKGNYFKATNFQTATSLLAIILSLLAVYVSWRQLRIYENQLKSSVWPYLEMRYVQRDNKFKIVLFNQGVGPAVIKSSHFQLRGKTYTQLSEFAEKELTGLQETDLAYTTISNVVSANQSIELISIKADSLLMKSIVENLELEDFKIIYSSIYDECWELSGKDGVKPLRCVD